MMDKKFIIVYVSAILITLIGGLLMYNQPVISDEPAHAGQITYFLENNFNVFPHLTVIPGYHIIMYGFCKILGVNDIGGMRMLQGILLTLVLLPIIYLLTRNIRKTLLFYFFPTLFSFYFLIYTDLMSLFFVLLAYYLLINKKPTMSGIAILIAILIRQNNIVWLGMLMIWAIIEMLPWYATTYLKFPVKGSIIKYKIKYKELIIQYLQRYWMYMIDCLLFLIFFIYNKGIIIYDRESHPLAFHFNNIWFILFIGFFLFLPLILYKYKEIGQIWAGKKAWYLFGALVLIIITYENGHWYNQLANVGFLKNDILQWAANNLWNRVIYGLVCVITLSWLMTIRFRNIKYYLIYPFSVVVLSFSWMIDIRYYTIPIVLFLIFRQEESEKEEWMMLGYAVLIALMMFIGIYRHSMFW